MKKRKLYLFVFVLLLVSVGIVVASSSTGFISHRFVLLGGGTADSPSYSVTSVIGQPATNVANSKNYEVSAGFLHPRQEVHLDHKVWLPAVFN